MNGPSSNVRATTPGTVQCSIMMLRGTAVGARAVRLADMFPPESQSPIESRTGKLETIMVEGRGGAESANKMLQITSRTSWRAGM